MSLIENERTKLLAGALDRASTACITVGLLAPVAAVLYGATGALLAPVGFAVISSAWFLMAVVLHLTARRILGGLK